MEDVLNAVHNHWRVGHFGELYNALQAQEFGAVCSPQQLEEHIERAGGNCLVRGKDKRANVLVVPIDIMVMVAVGVCIGFSGEPSPDVGDLRGGIVKPASQQAARLGLAIGCIENWRSRV